MSFHLETYDAPQPASKAQSAALMAEVMHIALYGGQDPWNASTSGVELAGIDTGHIAEASPKSGGPNIYCKYDPSVRDELLYGSHDKVHVAALAIGGTTYDIFASTTEDHTLEDDDVLAELFDLLENNEGSEEIEIVRTLDLSRLTDDVTIEVFKGLPDSGRFLRTLGKFGVQFAELFDDDKRTGRIAEAEGMFVQADLTDEARSLEIAAAVATIDSQTARTLITALREDYEPIVRW